MENSAIIPLALTFIAGASTAIGAALTFFMRKNDFRVLALGMSFSAGVMIYISFMDIMPMSVDFISGGEGFLKGKAGTALAYAMFFVGVIAADRSQAWVLFFRLAQSGYPMYIVR